MAVRHPWLIPQRQQAARPLQVVHRMAFETVDASPMTIAKLRASKLLADEVEAVFGPTRAAFVAFRAGHGNVRHWQQLVDCINVGTELAASHQMASDHKGTFKAAEAALAAVFTRQQSSLSWTLRGTEIAALDLAVQVSRAQLLHCSRGELGEAVTTVTARIQAALRGDHAPGAVICDPGQPTTTPAAA